MSDILESDVNNVTGLASADRRRRGMAGGPVVGNHLLKNLGCGI